MVIRGNWGPGPLAPETGLRAIPWKRREVSNKVAEECGRRKAREATCPGTGVQREGGAAAHGMGCLDTWGPWVATWEVGQGHPSGTACLSPNS